MKNLECITVIWPVSCSGIEQVRNSHNCIQEPKEQSQILRVIFSSYSQHGYPELFTVWALVNIPVNISVMFWTVGKRMWSFFQGFSFRWHSYFIIQCLYQVILILFESHNENTLLYLKFCLLNTLLFIPIHKQVCTWLDTLLIPMVKGYENGVYSLEKILYFNQ